MFIQRLDQKLATPGYDFRMQIHGTRSRSKAAGVNSSPGVAAPTAIITTNNKCQIVSCMNQQPEGFMQTESPWSNPSSSVAV